MKILSRANETIFYALGTAIVLMAIVLSNRYWVAFDVTRDSRNSLSERSQKVVEQLDESATISLYAGHNPTLLQTMRDLVSRYQRASDRVLFEHKNIELDPSVSRDLNIQRDGEIIIRLGDREKRIVELSESAITDALSTLLLNGERKLVFLSGHGERNAEGKANHDLGDFSDRLAKVGYSIETLEKGAPLPEVSNNTSLVVASPERGFSAAEQLSLAQYINQGGNLLWLQDSDGQDAAKTLSRLLPVSTLPGVIVDTAAQNAGLPRPDFALGSSYPMHASLRNISGTSLFPRAVALQIEQSDEWQTISLLQSSGESWNETSPVEGNIQPDAAHEQVGPLNFGFAFERIDSELQQRVVVIGDGDFLANNWLGNGSNIAVGEQLMSWLTQVESAPLPPRHAALDQQVAISKNSLIALGATLLGFIPLCLFGVAGWQWRQSSG